MIIMGGGEMASNSFKKGVEGLRRVFYSLIFSLDRLGEVFFFFFFGFFFCF